MKSTLSGSLALMLMLLLALPAAALDWRVKMGLHDFVVPDESSHTFGVNGQLFLKHEWSSGLRYEGSYDLYFDNDKDKLDPDHIAVWWKFYGKLDRDFYAISPSTKLSWLLRYDGKRNTVSSVEYQTLLFAGVALDYKGDTSNATVQATVGRWVFEIDDDVPKERGYVRGDFLNEENALSLLAEGNIRLGNSFGLGGLVQHWASKDRWLEDRLKADVSWETPNWRGDSRLILSAEYCKYNLEPYTPSTVATPANEYLPILPWDDDLEVRLVWDLPW